MFAISVFAECMTPFGSPVVPVVDQLRDVVGARPVLCQDRRCVRLLLPFRCGQQGIEIIRAAAVDDNNALQGREGRLKAARHLLMVKVAKSLGNDKNLCFPVPQHEREFALAENRHQRIEHGPDA
jgi:hypothetical protein